MAESQDQSVSLSAKRQETQPNPQETMGELTVQSDFKRKVAPEIRSILKTLYHSSCPYKDLEDSYSKRHSRLRADRLDGTCTWFIRLQSFGSWLTGDSPRLLWCFGAPGIGKSIIASLIIDGVASKSNEQTCAFYYMGNGKVQSAAGLILILLEQLCADGAELPPSLKPFYARNLRRLKPGLDNALLERPTCQLVSDEDSAIEKKKIEQSAGDVRIPALIPPEYPIFSDSTSEQKNIEESKIGKSSTIEHQEQQGLTLHHRPTLEVLLNALEGVSQETTVDTFIIIDGWDECNMDSEEDFHRLFGVLKTLPWKICIMSRRPPTDPDPTYCLCLHIRETDNAEDIKAFTENATKHTLLQRYQEFRQKAIQGIMESSQGIYIWARLSAKMILQSPDLGIVRGKFASSYLSQRYLPQPMPTIKRALEAIAKEPAGELSKMAIIWIAKLKQPLSLAALLESLSIGGGYQPAEVDASVIERCDGLVIVDEGNSYVHLAPYEIDETAKGVWPDSYNSTICTLAATCLEYLMLKEFGSGCRETEEELIQLLAAHPFLDYAARCWAYHRRDICDIQSSHANGKPERDNNSEAAKFPGTSANSSSQDDKPDLEMLSWTDFDGDAGKKNVPNDNNYTTVQSPNVTSGPGIQESAETFLETPNSSLALQILLYKDKATASFANQWTVHKEKVRSMSRLQKAARFGLTTLVENWATDTSDLCGKDSEGSTALHEAAKEGFEDVIERLIKDDSFSTVVTNVYKKTPMHLAMARGHHRAFNILFEKACAGFWREASRRVEVEEEDFWTEIARGQRLRRHRFITFANVEDGDKLITYYSIHNSGISNDTKRSREIALTNAINLRKEDVVSILLSGGVNADCRDEADVHALHLAIKTGSIPILHLLLDNDVDLKTDVALMDRALDHGGESCVHLAARLGMPDVVSLLLYEGADLEEADEQGRTVLNWALEASDPQAGCDVIKVLTRMGINVNMKDQSGRNVLHEAAQRGKSRAVRDLIWAMKDYSCRDTRGKTALDYAHEGGHEDAERTILKQIKSIDKFTQNSGRR